MSGVNEGLLYKILKLSILQQTALVNPASVAQLITGIPVPQAPISALLHDARFAGLYFRGNASTSGKGAANGPDASYDIQAIFLLVRNKAWAWMS